MTLSTLFVLVAVALFLWFAALNAGWVTFGTAGVVLGFALASFAASFLPWGDRVLR